MADDSWSVSAAPPKAAAPRADWAVSSAPPKPAATAAPAAQAVAAPATPTAPSDTVPAVQPNAIQPHSKDAWQWLVNAVTGNGRKQPGVGEVQVAPIVDPLAMLTTGVRGKLGDKEAELSEGFFLDSDPESRAKMIKKAYPEAKFRRDEYGQLQVRADPKGKWLYLNRPGLSGNDVQQFVEDSVKFLPSVLVGGGAPNILARVLGAGASASGIEAASQTAGKVFGGEGAKPGDVAGAGLGASLGQSGGEILRGAGLAAQGAAGKMDPSTGQKFTQGLGKFLEHLSGIQTREAKLATDRPEEAKDAYSKADKQGIPLTRGQASGDPRMRQEEYAMHMGGRGEQPQHIMRDFADEQAAAIHKRAVEIARAGQDSTGASTSEAGQDLQEELRKKHRAKEAEVDQAYDEMFQLARKDAIHPANATIADKVRQTLNPNEAIVQGPGGKWHILNDSQQGPWKDWQAGLRQADEAAAHATGALHFAQSQGAAPEEIARLQGLANQAAEAAGGLRAQAGDAFEEITRGTRGEEGGILPSQQQAHAAIANEIEHLKRASTAPKRSLAGFVTKLGGIGDDRGDVLGMIGDHRQRPGLLNKRGRQLDDVITAAHEAGFFDGERPPDQRVFLDALRRDLRGEANDEQTSARQALNYWAQQGIDTNLRGKALRDHIAQALPKSTIPDYGNFADDDWNEWSILPSSEGYQFHTPEGRAEWANENVTAEPVPGESDQARQYGFKMPDGDSVVVQIAPLPENGHPAEVEWTFGGRYGKADDPYVKGQEQYGVRTLRDLRSQIAAVLEKDVGEHNRPAYVFTPATDAHRRFYAKMAEKYLAQSGYESIEVGGDIYMLRPGVDISQDGHILHDPEAHYQPPVWENSSGFDQSHLQREQEGFLDRIGTGRASGEDLRAGARPDAVSEGGGLAARSGRDRGTVGDRAGRDQLTPEALDRQIKLPNVGARYGMEPRDFVLMFNDGMADREIVAEQALTGEQLGAKSEPNLYATKVQMSNIRHAIRRAQNIPGGIEHLAQRMNVSPGELNKFVANAGQQRIPTLRGHARRLVEQGVTDGAELRKQLTAYARDFLDHEPTPKSLTVTISQARGEAGLTTKQPPARPAERARIIDLRKQGLSQKSIASKTGIDITRVRNVLSTAHQQGVAFPELRVRPGLRRRDGSILPSAMTPSAQPFYSGLARAVSSLKQEKASPEQWAATISRLPGVKKEELEWTGLADWLKGQTGSISKSDVQAFLDQNGVKVEEVVKGERSVGADENERLLIAEQQRARLNLSHERDALMRRHYGMYGRNDYTLDGKSLPLVDQVNPARTRQDLEAMGVDSRVAASLATAILRDDVGSRSSNSILDSIKQMIHAGRTDLIPPDVRDGVVKTARRFRSNPKDQQEIARTEARISDLGRQIASLDAAAESKPLDTKWSSYALPGGEPGSYRELLLTLPVKVAPEEEAYETYRKRIQYGELNSQDRAVVFAERDRLEAAARAVRTAPFTSSHFDEKNILAHVRFDDRVDADGKKTLLLNEIQSDLHQAGRDRGYREQPKSEDLALIDKAAKESGRFANAEEMLKAFSSGFLSNIKDPALEAAMFRVEDLKSTRRVPDAPFKNNAWASLALKRMIRHAAEHGYDNLSWVTGARSKEIVGGKLEGQQAFYDKILPNLANDIAKKYGAKVGESKVDAFDESQRVGRIEGGKWTIWDRNQKQSGPVFGSEKAAQDYLLSEAARMETVHSLPITPELREAALGGMPLFSNGRKGAQNGFRSPQEAERYIKGMYGGAVGDWMTNGDLLMAGNPEQARQMLRAMGASRAAGMVKEGDSGFHVPGLDKSFLIASNLSPKTIKGVIKHELGGHHSLEEMLGKDFVADIHARVQQMVAQGHPAAVEAMRRVRARGTPAQHVNEEATAYLIEKAPELPLVKRIIAGIRDWLYRTFPEVFKDPDQSLIGKLRGHAAELSDSDIRDLAVASLRRYARRTDPKLAAGYAIGDHAHGLMASGENGSPRSFDTLQEAQAAAPSAEDFADAPEAQKIIDQLQDKIERGLGNFGVVERARQQLNRMYRTAAGGASPDYSKSHAIEKVLDVLDQWTDENIKDPAAKAAMLKARGAKRDMAQIWGQSSPNDKAVGKRLKDLIEATRTGEDIAKSVIGAGHRPPATALAELRQIKKIAHDNPSLKPGEKPRELIALRESMLYKIMEPIMKRVGDSKEGEQSGKLVPFQTISKNLERALDGPGKQVMEELFSPEEIGELRELRQVLDRGVPPDGVARSGTPYEQARMANTLFKALLGSTGVGGHGALILDSLFSVPGHVVGQSIKRGRANEAISRIPMTPGQRSVAPAGAAIGAGLYQNDQDQTPTDQ